MKQVKLEKSIEAQIAQYDQNMLFQQAEYDANEAEQGGYSNYSYWRSTWRSFTKNKIAIFFLCLWEQCCCLQSFSLCFPTKGIQMRFFGSALHRT